MNENEAIVAIATIIAGTFSICVVAIAAARVFSSRRRQELPDDAVSRLDERLSRIEVAIDAMATEVERVSEGQRFTSRLLAERNRDRSVT